MSAMSFTPGPAHISTKLIISYVVDWVVIIIVAGFGAYFFTIHGNAHTFNLYDQSIAYPYNPDTVSITLAGIIAVLMPAAVIFLISMLLVPGPTVPKGTSSALIWRRKLWEWNTGWMGLALSLALTLFFATGLKDLLGKPRPYMLARCNPDLSNISKHVVSGVSSQLQNAPTMVSISICQNTDQKVLYDAFSAFPSGHSSISFAGLLYLTLFLASKFSITIPYLSPASDAYAAPVRNRAAAPPLPALVFVLAPIGIALFIAASRWFDNAHSGFDIIISSFIGIMTAWFSFRWYHLPVSRGSGWSWGARSSEKSFWIGVGEGNWAESNYITRDVEPGFSGVESMDNRSPAVGKPTDYNPNRYNTQTDYYDGPSGLNRPESMELRQVPVSVLDSRRAPPPARY